MTAPPRRPSLRTRVTTAPPVVLALGPRAALTALAAVHDARLALRARGEPSQGALLAALESLERELGVAIGAERARAFLRRRKARGA